MKKNVTRPLLTALSALAAILATALYCRPRRVEERNKLILSWVPFFGNPYYYFGDGTAEAFAKAGCDVTACEIVTDQHRVPLKDFDAILFHGYEYYELLFGTPKERSPKQLYVYMCLESARRTSIPESRRNFYNITMTYRLDSDYPWPYFVMVDGDGTRIAPYEKPKWSESYDRDSLQNITRNILARKKKMAAWFVSNCNSVSGREEYVDELRKYGVQVDIYGTCGTMKCPITEQKRCASTIGEYYFYLSFENSLCADYVTEKTMNALEGDSVPVVLSGADLNRFLPPNSYLDATKLGAKALAEEMLRLSSHPEEYAQMFWWRTVYEAHSFWGWAKGKHPLCSLCAALHNGFETKRRSDVKDWWTTTEQGNNACLM